MAFWAVVVLLTSMGPAVLGEHGDPSYATKEDCEKQLSRVAVLAGFTYGVQIGIQNPIMGSMVFCSEQTAGQTAKDLIREMAPKQDI